MKNIFKNILKLTFICSLFVLSGCEKDLYEDNIKSEKGVSKYITFNEFKTFPKAYNLYDKINTDNEKFIRNNNGLESRLIYNEILGFTINTDKILYSEKEGLKTFTFEIYRNTKDLSTLENLVITFKDDSEFESYLTKYEFTPEEIELIKNGLPAPNLVAKMSIKTLSGKILLEKGDFIGGLYHINGYCYVIDHISYSDIIDPATGTPFINVTYIPIPVECPEVIAGTTGNESGGDTSVGASTTYYGPIDVLGSSNNDGNYYGVGSWSNYNGGGSGTNPEENPNNYSDSEGILLLNTSPVLADAFGSGKAYETAKEIKFQMLPLEISNPQFNYLLTHAAAANEILNYLQENNSEQAKAYIEQLIVNMVANPSLKFDVTKSSKSPMNIDLTKVQDTTAAARKFRCIYEKLIMSPTFKNLFVNMFQDNTRPNVVFEIADFPGDANGGKVGETTIIGNNRFNNTIKIDSDLLENGKTMNIVQVILHECIHAFLNIKLADSSIGVPIPQLNDMDVTACIQNYYNNFGDPQAQHNFIFNYMMNTMKEVFQEVKDLFVPQQISNDLQNLTLHIDQNTTPITNISTPWDWNDFYENLALNGLQNCSAFASEIATVTNGVPTNVVDHMKWSKFNEYKIVGSANLPNACN